MNEVQRRMVNGRDNRIVGIFPIIDEVISFLIDRFHLTTFHSVVMVPANPDKGEQVEQLEITDIEAITTFLEAGRTVAIIFDTLPIGPSNSTKPDFDFFRRTMIEDAFLFSIKKVDG